MSLEHAFFIKNVPGWERAMRSLLALAVIAYGLVSLATPWSWAVAASGAILGISGVIGFCPLCAMVGRKLKA